MSVAASDNNSNRKIVLGGSLGGLLAMVIVGFLIFSSVCPCERTPGGFLFGKTADSPVADWNFVNEVPLCQLQIYAGIRPHSINLNCMSTPEGEMFLSCSVCDTKYWAARVDGDEPGVMRLNGKVYPVKLNRVLDPDILDRAWLARITKLQNLDADSTNLPPDQVAQRPERWWTFQVESRI